MDQTNDNKISLISRLVTLDQTFRMLNSAVPNADSRMRGQGIKIYDKTLSDPMVRGCFSSIVQAINSLEYELTGEIPEPQRAIYEDCIKRWTQQDIQRKILMAMLYGHNPIDVVWGDADGYLVPIGLYQCAHESFFYIFSDAKLDYELRVRTILGDFQGIPVPDKKLLMPTFDPSYHNPYGRGLLADCYKAVFIKDNAWNFWSIFVEDSGTPKLAVEVGNELIAMVKQEYPEYSDYQVLQQIEEDIRKAKSNGSFAYLKGMAVTSLTTGTSDHGVTHYDLINYCDNQVAILLLGHNGAAQSTPGKLGNENAALEVMQNRIESYSRFVETYINILLQWTCEMNFAGATAPRIRLFERDNVNAYLQKATYLSTLRAIGVEPTEDLISEMFNIDKDKFKLTNPPAATPQPGEKKPGEKKPGEDKPEEDKPEEDKPEEDKPEEEKAKSKTTKAHALFEPTIEAKDQQNDEYSEILDNLEKLSEHVIKTKEFGEANKEMIDSILKFASSAGSLPELADTVYDCYKEINTGKLINIMNRVQLVSRVYGQSTES